MLGSRRYGLGPVLAAFRPARWCYAQRIAEALLRFAEALGLPAFGFRISDFTQRRRVLQRRGGASEVRRDLGSIWKKASRRLREVFAMFSKPGVLEAAATFSALGFRLPASGA
jgi:hypothetical protein